MGGCDRDMKEVGNPTADKRPSTILLLAPKLERDESSTRKLEYTALMIR